MTERTIKILEAVIENFIASGKPVSSLDLYRRYEFGIKPAMIRSELEELVRNGFLEKPYHSSGRIPANRGYEFFIEKIIKEMRDFDYNEKNFNQLFKINSWSELVCKISRQIGIFVAATDKKSVCKSGLENMLKNLTEEMISDIRNIVRDFIQLEKKILSWQYRNNSKDFLIFVGKKNPFIRSDSLAAIITKHRGGDKETVIVAIGPKRMDYRETIRIFKIVQKSNKLSKLSIN